MTTLQPQSSSPQSPSSLLKSNTEKEKKNTMNFLDELLTLFFFFLSFFFSREVQVLNGPQDTSNDETFDTEGSTDGDESSGSAFAVSLLLQASVLLAAVF
jgi:hypothetical protein